MIRVIGFQKFLVIVILAAVVLLAALYTYSVSGPDNKRIGMEFRAAQSETAEIQRNMDDLVQGLEKFETQKEQFEVVQQNGFFDPQNRVQTRQRFSAMQKESELLSARYTIKPAVTEKNDKAKEAGYKIVSTDIDFSLEAVEDADIYSFIYLLNYGFPGQITITDLDMSRDIEITQPLLRKMGVGEAEALVKASLRVQWRTMLPDQSIAVTDTAQGDY